MAWPKDATHCQRGHELNEENVGYYADERRLGGRVRRCLVCFRANAAAWEAANLDHVRVRHRKTYRARQDARGVRPRAERARTPETTRAYNTAYRRAWRARKKAERDDRVR